jgi:hypothetical protein
MRSSQAQAEVAELAAGDGTRSPHDEVCRQHGTCDGARKGDGAE